MSKSKFVSILKVVPPNMTTQNGFVWPEKGPVECPDWDPKPECGSGLHGWRWTPSCDIDSSNGYHNDSQAKWLVVRVSVAEIVNLPGKVKFRSGTVIHCGTFEEAIKKIQKNPAIAGFLGTATAGHAGTATAGDWGTATAGHAGTATAGDGGVISILFFDESLKKYRRLAAEVGVTPGIEPGKKYRVENGRFVEVRGEN